MSNPPSELAFPEYPTSWYLWGTSRELRDRPISKTMLGKRLVAFRPLDRDAAILDGNCSHLAADLGRGCVKEGRLQCPFHQWEYSADGQCQRIPAQSQIPKFARQRAYPSVERHDLIFLWSDTKPHFSLPFFDGADPDEFVRGRPFRFLADCAWYMLVANGFDGQHFQAVHDRRLLEPPAVDMPNRFSRRIRYHAEIVGNSIYDRLLRSSVGDQVKITITNWGGSLVLVTGEFLRATSYILIATQPFTEFKTLVDVVVFTTRSRSSVIRQLTQWVNLEVRRLFTRGFMQDDIVKLAGLRYRRGSFVESDQTMVDFFRWLAALPQEGDVAIASSATEMENSLASVPTVGERRVSDDI